MRKPYKSHFANAIWLLIILLVISGHVFAQYSPENPAPLKEWTFLIYLDGDNDLEENALGDFLEMSSIGSNTDINIVTMLDRRNLYSDLYDDWTDTRRGYVQFGDIPDSSWGESLGEINMGDPQNLKDFLTWGVASFPANRTVLIMWNHGSGWSDYYASIAASYSYLQTSAISKSKEKPAKAICLDDTSDDELTLAEIRVALEELQTNELIYIDLFGMDACLMAMAEVITEIKDVSDYFVGSPAEEPLDGWPFDMIFQDLQINPLMSTSALGETIVNRYYQSYGNGETQVAVDLSGVDTLVSAVDSLAYNLAVNWQTQPEVCFTDAGNVITALDDLIIAEKHGIAFDGAHGISINFPTYGPESQYNSTKLQFLASTNWEEFLEVFDDLDFDTWVRSAFDYALRYESSWNYYDLYSFCEGVLRYSTDGIDVYPNDDFVFFGKPGGPFTQDSITYQITNTNSQPVDWQVSVPASWLIVSPLNGTLAASSSQSITVSVDPSQTASMSDGVYTANIEISDPYDHSQYITVLLALGVKDRLTELFSGSGDNHFDLAHKTITFSPVETDSFYSVCLQDASVFEVDASGATEILLGDDDSYEIVLEGNYLPFFGELYSSIYVGSNGYLNFYTGDAEFSESLANHFNLPRISAFFDDLAPKDGVTKISYLLDSDKLVVTYENIEELTSLGSQTSNLNSFQIQIFFNGIIKITWLDMGASDGLVGLSNGEFPYDFLESNLNRYQQCEQGQPFIPIALNSHFSMYQEVSKSIILSAYDDGLPQDLEYIVTSLPEKGSLFLGDTEITTTPYSLNANRILTYQIDPQDEGVDYFTWYANDGENDSNIAVTTIEIQPPVNYFTESFLAGESDISGLSVTFTPDNSISSYSACIDSLYELPNEPNDGTRILADSSNNDDSYYEVVLFDSKQVSLYGQSWSTFYVSANGYITFGQGTDEYQFSLAEHFSIPRISLFYLDLNPEYGGEVLYQQLEDRVVVSFVNVRDRNINVTYTFQAELYFDGVIKIHWLDADGNSDIAGIGLSEGQGAPSAFEEYDFSSSSSCILNNPVALDSVVETWAGQSVPVLLNAQFADEYVIASLPQYGSLYVGQTLIESVPFGLGGTDMVLYTADREAQSADLFQWYCYDSTSDMMTVSNLATVDIQIHSCDNILEPEVVMPADQNVCSQVNLPLMWDVPVVKSKSGINFSYARTDEQQKSILNKELARSIPGGDLPTVSALPTKAFIDNPGATVDVLMYVKYANNNAGREVENTLNAVSQYYTDFSVTLTDEDDPILLGQLLESHQVFLIPEQENTTIAFAENLGESWSTVLTDFVDRGGIVIACDYVWGGYALMNSAGLMQVQVQDVYPQIINGQDLEKISDNLITENVEQTFASSIGSVAYDSTDDEVLIEYQGYPVAIASYSGHGMAVLLGWDYFSYDNNIARIIANAVRLGAADLNYDIYLDTVDPPVNQVAHDYRFKIFDPGILETGTQYYWKVDVSNNCGDYVSGPVWSFTTTNTASDFDGDCKVDMADMAYLAANWLNSDCSAGWFRCDGTDIDRSGDVGFSDLGELATGWLSTND